ncbi:MAG: cation diffusion facilitator family transporter [Anaerolineae bacterium]
MAGRTPAEIRNVRHESLDRSRRALYRRATVAAIVGNAVLAAAKGVVAWKAGSSAVLSDAANSLSDTFYSAMMVAGLYLAQQPADETHPQGHSRFEPMVSLFIAVAMGLAGFTAVGEGVRRFRGGGMAVAPTWPTVALVGSAVVKLLMYRLLVDWGRRARSPALRASARDNLADVLASLAAWVGVLGSNVVHPVVDPLAGIAVALWIFRAMWEVLRENLGYLTGRGAPPEVIGDIVDAASAVPGVLDVHQVIADYVGPELRVDMHVDVDGNLTLDEAHAIGEDVQEAVQHLDNVDLAFVHVEPPDR